VSVTVPVGITVPLLAATVIDTGVAITSAEPPTETLAVESASGALMPVV
jgi:hypothetical protein